MQIIRISTDNMISVHDFPTGSLSEQNQALCKLIGPRCETLEHVLPKRLYTELMVPGTIMRKKGGFVSMLIDEDGMAHKLDCNIIGSYLYKTDKYGWPILGNILFVGEKLEDKGVNFCGISSKQFEVLYRQLKEITEKVRDLA